MSFHFCSHSWEVRDVEDGILVKLSPRDLGADTISVMVDELIVLAMESGRPNLYLDFSNVQTLASIMLGKLLALDNQLRAHGGRLILVHVDRQVYRMCQATRLTDVLDIRPDALMESVA
jgi:anti-anti-sigma factor